MPYTFSKIFVTANIVEDLESFGPRIVSAYYALVSPPSHVHLSPPSSPHDIPDLSPPSSPCFPDDIPPEKERKEEEGGGRRRKKKEEEEAS